MSQNLNIQQLSMKQLTTIWIEWKGIKIEKAIEPIKAVKK